MVNIASTFAVARPIAARYVKRMLRDFDQATREDAEQSVALALLDQIIPNFVPDRGTLLGYLRWSIRNAIIDIRRKLILGRQRFCSLADYDFPVPQAEPALEISEVAAQLPPRHARLLDALMGKATRAELAEEMGISIHTLDCRIRRLTQGIRRIAASA